MENVNTNMNLKEALYTYIDRALEPDLSAVTTSFDDGNGNQMLLTKQSYHLMNAKGKQDTLTINNPRVIEAVSSYNDAERAASTAAYIKVIALAKLADNMETLTSMGFKTVGKFAYHMWNLSENTANQYARIGKYLINPETKLPLPVFPDAIPVSTMLEFLTYVVDEKGNVNQGLIASLYADGTIVDGMSASKVRAKLKERFKALPAAETSTEKKEGEAKAKKEGKKEGEADPRNITFIENVQGLSPVQCSAAILSNLSFIEEVLKTYPDDNFPNDKMFPLLEVVREYARAIAEKDNSPE